MVHPYMRQSKDLEASSNSSNGDKETVESVTETVTSMLPRLHVLIIGPGLGRDKAMHAVVARTIKAAREKNIPLVLDADALLVVQDHPDLISGYAHCILTPNVVEFQRLAKARNLDLDAIDEPDRCKALSEAYGGVTVVQKGTSDTISNGALTLVSSGAGALKRSGGQGDTLTGVLGTLLAWRGAYLSGLWEHDSSLSETELLALAAFAGSAVTRECARLAFAEKGRSMQAGDLTGKVHEAFLGVVGETTARL